MRYVFDLDGTLCTQPDETMFERALPIAERIAEVNRLHAAGHHIVIDTARGSRTGMDWHAHTEQQLALWGVKYDELYIREKPSADHYVDDRAVHPDAFFGVPLASSLRAAPDVGDFARRYFDRLRVACASVPPDAIEALLAEIDAARDDGATTWAIGNGGSASAADHIANGLGGYMALRTGNAHRIVSLATNTAALTGLSNDSTFEDVFTAQLAACYRPGDRLLALSCSGNSANIVRAAAWVAAAGGRVIGMVGFDGGALLPLCDVAIHVRSEPGEYGPVEDAHMAIAHVLVHWYQREAA